MTVKNTDGLISEIISQISVLIIGAITFICALAWNEAFTNYFNKYPGFKKWGIWVYATSVTIFGVIIIILLKYFTKNIKEKENKV